MAEKKTFHKPTHPFDKAAPQSAKSALPPGMLNLWAKWNSLPTRVRLYVGLSTFAVAFCADRYLTYSEKQISKGKVIVKQLGNLEE
jgi:hypothetical protein